MSHCELFNNYFDAVVSLGDRCVVAENLRINNLTAISSPFDWIISQHTSHVINQFDTDFTSFFNIENQQLAEIQDQEGHFVILDKHTSFESRHDIPIPKESVVLTDAFKQLKLKLSHKVESFYTRINLCNRILFVRRSDDITDIDTIKLKESLERAFKNKEVYLLVLKNSPNESIHKIKKDTWVLHSRLKYVGISPYLSWQEDYGAWNSILNKIKLISPLERLEKILKEKLNNRSIIIWGMGNNFRQIENLLKLNGFLDYHAYDKKLSPSYRKDRILAEPTFLSDRKKFFVIVNTVKFYGEIFEVLSKNKFEMLNDYFFY